jgi:5'/3'-nucleotidase
MRILLTNDDGIHAPGLESLVKIAAKLSDDVWIVAPETEQSGASHSLSLSDPLRMRKVNDRRFAVRGTPTDCVLMAVKSIMPELPDLILSGVNRGQNIADDVTYSGTIAAAMEGTALGIPSIALSQAMNFSAGGLKWQCAEHHGAGLIAKFIKTGWGRQVLLNINFPDTQPEDIRGIEITRQGKRDLDLMRIDERVDARGQPYYWIGFNRSLSDPAGDTDLKAIYDFKISITPLHLDLTHEQSMQSLRQALA